MASSLLPPATFAKKYPVLLHPHIYSAKPHAHKLIRCGASATDGGAAVPDELLSVPPNQVAPVVGDTTYDGWAAFLDELKGAMQADPSNAGAAIPDELLSAPLSDATNAGEAVVPDELLMSVDPSSPVSGDVTTNGGAAVIPDELMSALHLDASNPVVRAAAGALSRLDELMDGLTDAERWALFGFLAVTWLYLTARPGVLSGAVDAYVLAPLQLALDSVLGRRNLKMNNFVVGERIGEGSFGVVYSGAVVPRNGVVEERVGKAKTRLDLDDRYKEKVILKKVIQDKSGDVWSERVRRLRGVVQLPRGEGGAGVVRGVPREFRRRQDQVGVRQGRQMARLEVRGRPDAGQLPERPQLPVQPGAPHVRARAAGRRLTQARRARREAGDAAARHVPEAHPRHRHRPPRHQALQPRRHPPRPGQAHRLRRRHRSPHRQELRPRPRPARPGLLPPRALRPPRGDPPAPRRAHRRHPLAHPLAAQQPRPVRHVLGGDSADADGHADAEVAVGPQELQHGTQGCRLRPQQVAGNHAAQTRPADTGPRLRERVGPGHEAHLGARPGPAVRGRGAAAPVFSARWRPGRGRLVEAVAEQIGWNGWAQVIMVGDEEDRD